MSKVVLVCGLPASGKSTVTNQYLDQGYERLNRDTLGGKVADMLPKLTELLNAGKDVVLDNLFTTIQDRKPFVETAKTQKATVVAHFINTSAEDCQMNACLRMARKYGHVLTPEEIKDLKGKDPNTFPPAVLFKAKKAFQKPTTGEGFSDVKVEKFLRHWEDEFSNKALILDYDGTLRETVGGNGKFPTKVEEVSVFVERGDILRHYEKDGYILCGASNQSGIAKGDLTHEMATACFDHTNYKLNVKIDYRYDASRVPPVTSWSRKPMPGMGVDFIWKYKLNPSKCIMVGDMTSDKTFAARCGFQYQDQAKFFA